MLEETKATRGFCEATMIFIRSRESSGLDGRNWIDREGWRSRVDGESVGATTRVIWITRACHITISIRSSLNGRVLHMISAPTFLGVLRTSDTVTCCRALSDAAECGVALAGRLDEAEDTAVGVVNPTSIVRPCSRKSSREWWNSSSTSAARGRIRWRGNDAVVLVEIEPVRTSTVVKRIGLTKHITSRVVCQCAANSISTIAFRGVFETCIAVTCIVACIHTALRSGDAVEIGCIGKRTSSCIIAPATLRLPVSIRLKEARTRGRGGNGCRS